MCNFLIIKNISHHCSIRHIGKKNIKKKTKRKTNIADFLNLREHNTHLKLEELIEFTT